MMRMMANSRPEWDLILLGENESLQTQTIWHAVSIARSKGIQERDIVIIDYPKDQIVCCGLHQSIDQVVDIKYCNNNGIAITRRAVGGGAVLLDKNQLFYNVISHIDSKIVPRRIEPLFSTLLAPVVDTYKSFGIDAVYRPINDILVNNRKISGNGAGIIEKAQVLVGNFILDFPRKEMVKVLRVPNEKFRDKVHKSLSSGISSFKDELGIIPPKEEIIKRYVHYTEKRLGIKLKENSLKAETIEIMKELNTHYQSDDWLYQVSQRGKNLLSQIKIHSNNYVIESNYKAQGGLVQVTCEFQGSILKDILISGDFWIYPDTLLPYLEESLKGFDVEHGDLASSILHFLRENDCESPGTSAQDLAKPIIEAYQQLPK